MAVTIKPTLSLSSSNTTGNAVSFSVTSTITLGDNDIRSNRKFVVPDHTGNGGIKLIDTGVGKSYVFVKNTHPTVTVHLAGTATYQQNNALFILAPGEFTWFPFTGVNILYAIASPGATGEVEAMIFEA